MSALMAGDTIEVAAPDGSMWPMRVVESSGRSVWARECDKRDPARGRLLLSDEGTTWRRRRQACARELPAPVLACAVLGFPRELADFFA